MTIQPGHPHPHPHAHGHDDSHHYAHAAVHAHRGSVPRRIGSAVAAVFGAAHSHDAADRVDDALEADAAGRRALLLSFAILAVTAAVQAVVVVLSGSVALLGDTLHNIADALTAVPLFVAFRLAQRPPTKRHTYGFGRAEDLGGLFVVAMIALSSALAGWEAVDRLIRPRDVHHLWPVAAAAASSATRSSPATGCVSASSSAVPRWWPTGCTRAPTASRAWPSCSVRAV